MNEFTVLIYLVCFAVICGATFAFMFKSMTVVFNDMAKPRKRNIHPEMADVKTGEELLVFRSEEDDDDDDGGDVVIIRQ